MTKILISIAAWIALCAPVMAAQSSIDPQDPLPRKSPMPLEDFDGFSTHYSSVEVASKTRLRVMVTRPDEARGELHPLLFTQWVSCGSLEFSERGGGELELLARHSGLSLVRVDRTGSGDSQGPGCDQLDYLTEVAHYVSAFQQLLESGEFDTSKIFIYGSSLGSTTAPLVALALQKRGFEITGITVQGGGALTHFERMLWFDRYYLERRPDDVTRGDIHQQIYDRARFQLEYLVNGRHPDDVAKDSPAMAEIRSDIRGLSESDQYGRPFAWHQQAAQQNFLATWQELSPETQVLVIFNEFDQFESRHGHQLITATRNRIRPQSATYVELPNLGHSSRVFADIDQAYISDSDLRGYELLAGAILNWVQSQLTP